MRSRFDKALKEINDELIEMGSFLELALKKVAIIIKEPNEELLKEIKIIEKEVDSLEGTIQSNCLKLLGFQQPVARDLRAISTAINIITDMERIADQAVDIGEISMHLNKENKIPKDIMLMIEKCIIMVEESVDAFVKSDMDLARKVILSDDEVDALFENVRNDLIDLISEDKSEGPKAIDFIMIAKYLERIADHAVNISEWVIFKITGDHKNKQIL